MSKIWKGRQRVCRVDMERIKLKCPLCGRVFETQKNENSQIECPQCLKTIPVLQAEKYFSSLNENTDERKEAHGEDYHKVRLLISEAYDLISDEKYDLAEEKVTEALNLTDTDYRVFMAMVAIKTKNFSDLKDESHKVFLNKAISVADADGKKDITSIYKNYYTKSKFDKEQMSAYTTEELKLKKSKAEKGLKSLIPDHMARIKRNKIFLLLFPISFIIGISLTVIFLIFEQPYLLFIGIAFFVCGYVLFRNWFINKDKIIALNAILDLYDYMDEKIFPEETLVKFYDLMFKIYGRFADKDPIFAISRETIKMVDLLLSLKNEELNNYIFNDKYLAENIPEEKE